MAKGNKILKQCSACGALQGTKVEVPERCLDGAPHKFRALDRKVLASALGSTGGRPKVYATEKERREARLQTFARANSKRRKKSTEVI